MVSDLDSSLTEASDTTYYFYLTAEGKPFISDEIPEWRNDLQGAYFPYATHRFVAECRNDSSSNLVEDIIYHRQGEVYIYRESGVFFKNDATSKANVFLVGGGGAGGSGASTGGTGGTSYIVNLKATGGTGGSPSDVGFGGVATGGYVNQTGRDGLFNTSPGGGTIGLITGKWEILIYDELSYTRATLEGVGFGNGGYGGNRGGGGGGALFGSLNLTRGNSYVRVGKKGIGAGSPNGSDGADGVAVIRL